MESVESFITICVAVIAIAFYALMAIILAYAVISTIAVLIELARKK